MEKDYSDNYPVNYPEKLPSDLRIKDLYHEHESHPKNQLLADVFYYSGYIDSWGRGILNIIKFLKEDGLSLPSFEGSGGYFRIVFKRVDVPENVPENRIKSLLDQIKKDKFITIPKLSLILNVTEKTIKRDIQKLKEDGILKRIGPDKGGHWEVVK